MFQSKCSLILPEAAYEESYSDRILYQSDRDVQLKNHQKNMTQVVESTQQKQMQMQMQTQPIKKINQRTTLKPLILSTAHVRQENIIESSSASTQNRSQLFSKLIVFFHSSKFMRKMLSSIRPSTTYNRSHYNLIKDKASSYRQQLHPIITKRSLINLNNVIIDVRVKLRYHFRKLVQQAREPILLILTQIPLIDSDSLFKKVWDAFLCLVRFYLIICVPIIMSFQNLGDIKGLIGFNLAVGLVLITDILMRAFTIQLEHGLHISDRAKLAGNQWTISTLFEMMSIIILIILTSHFQDIVNQHIFQGGWPKLLFLLLIPQLQQFIHKLRLFQDSLNLSKSTASLIELAKLIGLIILIQHLFSCIWLILGFFGESIQIPNWIEQFDSGIWYIQYLESFYYISVTMFTVGYGEIHPNNALEKIFCILFMFLCTMQLSYSVNTIGGILTQLSQSSERIRQQIITINQYMQNKKINHSLQSQIRDYFNFYYKQELEQQSYEQTEFIQLLPEDLRQKLTTQAAKSLLDKCSFFKQNFSQETINILLSKVHYQAFHPGVVINGTSLNYENCVCIVENGQVEVYQDSEMHNRIATIVANQYFGLWEFIHSTQQSLYFKSSGFTSILVVPQSILLDALQNKQGDYHQFCIVRDNIQYGQQCYICKNTDKHSTQSCNQVHYVPDYETIIKRYLYIQQQDRDRQYSRNSKRKRHQYHALGDSYLIEETIKVIVIEQETELEELFPDLDALIQVTTHRPTEQEFQPRIQEESDYQYIHQQQLLGVNSNRKTKPSFPSQLILCQQFNKRSSLQEEQLDPALSDVARLAKHLKLFKPIQQEQIFMLHSKLENLNAELNFNKLEFEKSTNFTRYYPQWNIENVLNNYSPSSTSIPSNTEWTRYLLYPYLFLWGYRDKGKFKTIQTCELISERKPKPKTVNKMLLDKRQFTRGQSRRKVHPSGR